ncbi:hypothetical protein PRIPAC_75348 [Pristionchus pacificus]|uniref:Solute carrier organic anion transporter family member n=1 Tax=Pristionchus pacificus TaxID=54126 RepID=A0A2A6CFP3_PRIPA|nr:hypothetical protein PRIPAC_75348 [Pristionchus pacificus]|eukprot:PDM77034.1 membrane transporter [Pristionchus pacificus]
MARTSTSQSQAPKQSWRPSLNVFIGLMLLVVAIQGCYLGYVVGMLTTLEKRFGISSSPSGALLSVYDVGHTLAILAVGYFGEKAHQPRITGIGIVLSSLSMFILALPALCFGTVPDDELHVDKYKMQYIEDSKCDSSRFITDNGDCAKEKSEHTWALVLLMFGQLLAGIFSAPFNTLAYVFIDNNIEDRRRSPFILGLLTSMYAFGPAFGFALSAVFNQFYATLGEAPTGLVPSDEEWVGAWWLGFIVCGVLYLLTAAPFFFFPASYQEEHGVELQSLRQGKENKPSLPPFEEEETTGCARLKESMSDFPSVLADLLRNPVYVTMVLGWMFGSYLIAGYGTYLPKYIETQFGRSASMADLYAGIISIGAVASATAIGGYVLSRSNVGPRAAILLLLGSWIIVVISYLSGIIFSCQQPSIHGLEYVEHVDSYTFNSVQSCSSHCQCDSVTHFDPINFDGINYFSPCHAGCRYFENYQWRSCDCFNGADAYHGVIHEDCTLSLVGYIIVMFVGLFLGNLFFMTTMMIVLRSVYDDQKVIALSFASCITNMLGLGFIPAPLILGWLIDRSCILWHSTCTDAPGNCVIYDNEKFRIGFHASNAGLQLAAVLCVLACWLFSRKQQFPEEEEFED